MKITIEEFGEVHTTEEWEIIEAARPWWKRQAEDVRFTVEAKYGELNHSARQRWQKLTTGTNSSEWANLDSWLTKELGMRLRVMAQKTQSYPAGSTPEEWITLLDTLGRNLQSYNDDLLWDEENWLDIERENHEKAKEALRWIADNLEMLWS